MNFHLLFKVKIKKYLYNLKMNVISLIFSILAALEHIYILYLETVITDSEKTSKVFGIGSNELKTKTVSALLKNQGIYNGLLSVLLFISIFRSEIFWIRLFLTYIIIVAIYGGITSNPKIIFKQGSLAIIALLFSFY